VSFHVKKKREHVNIAVFVPLRNPKALFCPAPRGVRLGALALPANIERPADVCPPGAGTERSATRPSYRRQDRSPMSPSKQCHAGPTIRTPRIAPCNCGRRGMDGRTGGRVEPYWTKYDTMPEKSTVDLFF
jgi:hypothetical protein